MDRDLGEFNYVRIKNQGKVVRGRVLSASNYGGRGWIPGDPDDWYIEFRHMDDKGNIIPQASAYLKQVQDGYGNAEIEFKASPFLN
jgi:hypothetical protein